MNRWKIDEGSEKFGGMISRHLRLNIIVAKFTHTHTKKKIGDLVKVWCLIDHPSVVTSSLAPNLVSLESFFISLSNDVPFVSIVPFLEEQRIWEADEVPRKM